MLNTNYDAFISYSRNDKDLVEPIYQLLSFDSRRVFWDARNIQPGDDWEHTIDDAISKSRALFLLWCCDSAESQYVLKEVEAALSLGKTLVPVRLCWFPMPHSISRYQWIDQTRLRHRCLSYHGAPDDLPPATGLNPDLLADPTLLPGRETLLKWEAISASDASLRSLALSVYGLLSLQDRVGLEQGVVHALRAAGLPYESHTAAGRTRLRALEM